MRWVVGVVASRVWVWESVKRADGVGVGGGDRMSEMAVSKVNGAGCTGRG
jgi:hypothetical protein